MGEGGRRWPKRVGADRVEEEEMARVSPWTEEGGCSLALSPVSFVPVRFEAHRSKGSGSHDPA